MGIIDKSKHITTCVSCLGKLYMLNIGQLCWNCIHEKNCLNPKAQQEWYNALGNVTMRYVIENHEYINCDKYEPNMKQQIENAWINGEEIGDFGNE